MASKPALTADQCKQVEDALERGELLKDCAVQLKVSVKTLQRAIKEEKIKKPVGTIKAKQTKADLAESELTVVNQLEGQLGVLRDENRVLKSQLNVAQKSSFSLQMLATECRQMIKPFEAPPESWKKHFSVGGSTEEALVLHLSDGHHDSVIHPHQVQNLERHDFNIAMARGEHLVDTVLDYSKNRLTGYNFNSLTILAYGDHTQGEIHKGVEHTHFGNMMRNCLAIGQFHAQMIRDFSEWFQEVNILYLSGNHGRRKDVAKKDYHHAWDSWDYLIAETAKSYCRDLWNVRFIIPDAFSAIIGIEDHNFCVFHGDDIKGWAGIPWYGIERKTRRLTALNSSMDQKVHYYCMGHFHAHATQQALKGETFINGAWVGCDPYSFNALDGYNEPMQLLHGVHSKYGATWRLPIKLRFDGDVEGPKRYKISLSDVTG